MYTHSPDAIYSFAINLIARVVEYTLSNYHMHAIDSESLEMRRKGNET